MRRFIAIISSSLALFLLSTFPSWYELSYDPGSEVDIRPFPSRPVSLVACALAFISSIILLLSSLWHHVAVVAYTAGVGSLAASAVRTDLGTTSIIFLWVSFATITIVGLGLVVMILSISILNRLVDSDRVIAASERASTTAKKQNVQQAIQPRPMPMRQLSWDDGDE